MEHFYRCTSAKTYFVAAGSLSEPHIVCGSDVPPTPAPSRLEMLRMTRGTRTGAYKSRFHFLLFV